MKHDLFSKAALTLITLFIFARVPFISPLAAKHYFYQGFDVVGDAVGSINRIKDNKGVCKVYKTYKIEEGLVTVETKILHNGYRKKPEFSKKSFKVDTFAINADSIKFIYNKTDKDYITQTTKGSKANVKIALNKGSKKFSA